jgi:hypothetical protein
VKNLNKISLLLLLIFGFIANSNAQTMTFNSGASEPGFSFSGFGYDDTINVLFPSAPNVNSAMTITKNSGCWDLTSFNPYAWSGNNPPGGGIWRASSNKGDQFDFTIPSSPNPIVLNWEKIQSFTVQLIDPGTGNPNNTFNFDDVVYSIPAYAPANAPNVTANALPICPGQNAVLNISGVLNDATHWAVYTGGCGGTFVTQSAGTTISLSPLVTTTYTVRGIDECGCAADGPCVDVVVTVYEESTAYTNATSTPDEVICPNEQINLVATGGIDGSGALTRWYTGPDGTGTLVGSGSNIVITPAGTATYYVRREGICNTTDDETVTVIVTADSDAPVITCPVDVLVEVTEGTCDPIAIALVELPTVSDICSTSLDNNAPALYAPGSTIVTWTAADETGNSATCQQTVTFDCSIAINYGDICFATPVTVTQCAVASTVAGDNTGANPSPSTNGACWEGGDASQHSEWFTAIVPADGVLAIQTYATGTLTNTQLQVYSSSDNTCDGTITAIACNDDIDAVGGDLMSQANLSGLTPGDVLFIEVDGFNGEEGTFGLSVSFCSGCTNPIACNYNPLANVDDGSCDLGLWYLPFDYTSSSSEPAVQACSAPPGYEVADDQACIENVIANDPFCNVTDWDQICQNAYLACCIFGCTDPAACNYDALATCDNGTCDIGLWYLPIDFNSSSSEPAVLACSPPAGYVLAGDQDCIASVIVLDDYCVTVDWDQTCQNAYLACCTPGCIDPSACNFDPIATCDNGTCVFPGCTDPAACNFDLAAGCDDGSCTNICLGCTYPNASNYDASANTDDATCEFPGCTDPAFDNYSASANSDDGSCMNFTSDCPSDFNNDGLVNSTDLLAFLGDFGTSCP